jgi:hypothetical protein
MRHWARVLLLAVGRRTSRALFIMTPLATTPVAISLFRSIFLAWIPCQNAFRRDQITSPYHAALALMEIGRGKSPSPTVHAHERSTLAIKILIRRLSPRASAMSGDHVIAIAVAVAAGFTPRPVQALGFASVTNSNSCQTLRYKRSGR